MRKIPKKNYFVLFAVILISIIICLYLVALYNNYKKYQENNSVLSNILHEIVPSDTLGITQNFDNFLLENSNLIIYISSSKNKNIKKFENEFYEFIVKNQLNHNIVYIDSNNISYKNFIVELQKNYTKDINEKDVVSYNNNPTLIVFKDGKLNDIYNNKNIDMYEVKAFLMRNGVIIND